MPHAPHYPGESEEYPEYKSEEEYTKWEPLDEEPLDYSEVNMFEEDETEEDETKKEKPKEKPKRKLGTGEKIYLYISSGPGVMSLAEPTFDSRIEAGQWAEENYPGAPYQTMSQSEVQDYVAKMQRRQEQLEKAKETVKTGAKKVGRGLVTAGKAFTHASHDVARESKMTRPQIERRMERTMRPSAGVTVNVGSGMMPTPSEYARRPQEPQRPQEPSPYYTKYGRPRQPLRTPRIQQPRTPRARIQAPQTTKRINIPTQGPFKPLGRPKQPTPFKSAHFDFSGMHTVKPHWIGKQPHFRRPYEEEAKVKEKTKKISTRAKPKKTKQRRKNAKRKKK